jgi:HlyD family secretion protein
MAQQERGQGRGWIWAVVALVGVLGLLLFLRGSRSAVTVRTARAEYQDINSTVSTNGKVEPEEDFQAHAPAPGVVAKLYVSLGQKVGRGQQLLKMDDSDARSRVAAAQATLQASQAALQNMQKGGTQDERLGESADLSAARLQQQQAQGTLASLQKLQAQGAASANEIAAAQQRVADAQSKIAQIQARQKGRYSSVDLNSQRAQVAQAAAALSAAQSGYAGVDIRSPLAGTVYAIPVAQYDFVQAGELLMDVADLTRLQIRAYFDEPEIGKLAVDQPVKIVWDAKPNQLWHGHILEAPTTVITYGTRNVGECLITVDDARGDLLPNTNVTVTVTISERHHVLSLPREALRTEGSINFVYRIVDGRLVRTPVQVGDLNLTRVQITGGLNEGDVVALGATTEVELSDNLRVKAQS